MGSGFGAGWVRWRRLASRAAVVLATVVMTVAGGQTAYAETFAAIGGAGSTWSANAIDLWRVNVNQYGMTVNYAFTGSSDGSSQFRNGTVDFAVSDLPYGLTDTNGTDAPPARPFAYVPIVAGGSSIAYNLKVGGVRVTNLRLSGAVVAKIFTGQIANWSDPAIQADNPGLALPDKAITRVVRSDGAATTFTFTAWLSSQHPGLWDAYCAAAGRPTPCGPTAYFPLVGTGILAASGSIGVAAYVRQPQSEGSIAVVEHSYALQSGLSEVKVLNTAGYYVSPTAGNVAVALTAARTSPNLIADLTGVYTNPDPRAYPFSSYSYLIVPTTESGSFTALRGHTLAQFASFAICQGQQQASLLSYSPLPINLVRAGLDQLRRVPGVNVAALDLALCNNPTFAPDGTNTLLATTPMPDACDHVGSSCGGPSGPASEFIETTVLPGALTISVDNTAVGLPNAQLTSDASMFASAGTLNPVTITDTRAGNPGWNVSGQVSDFTDATGHLINGANLGWSPTLIGKAAAQIVFMGAVVDPAAGIAPGAAAPPGIGLATSRTLAIGARSGGNGTAVLGAGLTLTAPTSTPGGTYTATLTFTVI